MVRAANDGDTQSYDALRQRYEESMDPGAWRELQRKLPYLNVMESSMQGVNDSHDVVVALDKKRAKNPGLTIEELYAEIDAIERLKGGG